MLRDLGFAVEDVRTIRTYRVDGPADALPRLIQRVLANDAIEQAVVGPLPFDRLGQGHPYQFRRVDVPIRAMDDDALMQLSRTGQLSLSLAEMQTIQAHFADSAATRPTASWKRSPRPGASTARTRRSRAGSSSTGEIDRQPAQGDDLRGDAGSATLGADDWCVSVFDDNAGVVRFDDEYDVCFKVETHNHPSAIEPYGGANTGPRRRDPRPARHRPGGQADLQHRRLLLRPARHSRPSRCPPGVLHPQARAARASSPACATTATGWASRRSTAPSASTRATSANPLVFCGTVGVIPRGQVVQAGRSRAT